jgi:1-acyl-sn-glycerol-3-phosphate acyltransferase
MTNAASTLISYVKFPLHLLLQSLNVFFWGVLIIGLGLLKFVVRIQPAIGTMNILAGKMEKAFGLCSIKLIKLFNNIHWDIEIDDSINKEHWYLLIANHICWLDIVLIMSLSVGRFPPPKFFLKKELIWIPFIGLGAWALDMPFMQRYSKQFLQKKPQLKGKDIEATRESCRKFKQTPTTVVNFVEGSRCTPAKQQQKNSPFKHLLPAKAGGISFTLGAMGEQFTHLLDATIAYPQNTHSVMVDLLKGDLTQVVIKVQAKEISPSLIGNYADDEKYRQQFQAWLNNIWQEKDIVLEEIQTVAK